MTKAPLLFASLAAAALPLAFSTSAHAMGPIDLEIGLRSGVGTTPSNFPSTTPNPLGFGLGARAGVDVFGFYGGLNLMYYFGGSSNGFSDHSLMEGVDVGYNIKLAIITIRPMVSIGNFTVSSSYAGASQDHSNLYLEPGVTGLVSLGMFYIGADVNALILTGIQQTDGSKGTDTALTVHGQLGLKF
ncbi:MAG TPA: hypothetical protein VIF09_09865 [Polyangiaceae bacterium]|jgi:hypothetical protein